MAQTKKFRRPAEAAPNRDAIRRCYVADCRAARIAFAYCLSDISDVPLTLWDLTASTDPDHGVRLQVSRTYQRDSQPAFSLTAEMSRDELRAFGRALVLLSERLGPETDAESWQEVHP